MNRIITRVNIFLFGCILNATTFAESVTSHQLIIAKPTAIQVDAAIQAKLGGTVLGLVALLSADKLRAKNAPLETLQALGNFLR